jgi:putative transposase
MLPRVEHRRHKGLNNRAENSHLPTRQRERRMQRFKSSEQAQRFLEPFTAVCNHFRPRRHRLTASAYRQLMDEQRQTWREVAAVTARRPSTHPGTSSVPVALTNLTTPYGPPLAVVDCQ